jgi:hypothetical protein
VDPEHQIPILGLGAHEKLGRVRQGRGVDEGHGGLFPPSGLRVKMGA